MSSVHTPNPRFPAWLGRRLDFLSSDFAAQPRTELSTAARRHFAMHGGDGRQLTEDYLTLIGRAWLVAGPHVTAPPWRNVPCLIDFLKTVDIEEPLLRRQLIILAGDHLRIHGWQCLDPFWPLTDALRDRSCRRYWAWLLRMVREQVGLPATDASGLVAARILVELHATSNLSGFVRRMRAWATALPEPEAINVNGTPTWTCPAPAVDRFSRRSLRSDVRFVHLATREDFEREATIMRNCVATRYRYAQGRSRLYFAVHGPATLRATAELATDERGQWRILDLRDRRNRSIPPTRVQARLTAEYCVELTLIGHDDPLLSEYLRAQADSENRWQRHGDAVRDRFREFVPGIGRQDPKELIQQLLGQIG